MSSGWVCLLPAYNNKIGPVLCSEKYTLNPEPKKNLNSKTPSPTGSQSPKYPSFNRFNLLRTLRRTVLSFKESYHSVKGSRPVDVA